MVLSIVEGHTNDYTYISIIIILYSINMYYLMALLPCFMCSINHMVSIYVFTFYLKYHIDQIVVYKYVLFLCRNLLIL